ncbi:putative short chain oxidoreductase [Diplodia seriata]|uniref:Putative short chain oxidoreductase n=1 Tax=Diplodia seriata TaxID=420778 RepID=A0A0G2HGL7_9PEZI|nr:putative short chain oxidoreductase [Diplodia seriata]
MASYLITGSTRGLGFALTTLLASKPASEVSKIFATGRKQNDALAKLVQESAGRVEFVQLDVTDPQSAKEAAKAVEKTLGGKGLDVLVNNAGIMNYGPQGIEEMTDLGETFRMNVIGVHDVTSAFLPLLRKGTLKKVFNMYVVLLCTVSTVDDPDIRLRSSTLGSITMAPYFGHMPSPAYKVSKAALNMLTAQYSLALADEGFTFVAICPGWVKTELGTDHADLTIEQSVNGISEIVFRVTATDTGKFFSVNVPGFEKDGQKLYDGSCRPW